jgi:hypothetical protein
VVWDPNIPDHTIPNSLYLSGRPSWWGNLPWPPIGPDLTPMVGQIPAQVRFLAMSTPTPTPTASPTSTPTPTLIPTPTASRYLVNQDFEGTGTPIGWTNSGGDLDYTGLVLAGSQSARMLNTSGMVYNLGVGYDELWTKMRVRVVACSSSMGAFVWFSPAFDQVFTVCVFPNNTLTIDFVTYAPFNIGTTYYFWSHYHKNSPSDVWFSTTDNRSTATHLTTRAGNYQLQYPLFTTGVTVGNEVLYDNIQVAKTDEFGGEGPTP